ncbi:MAG: hypothetical protein L6Q33_12715 [Bacteriovoracaceae bacterium]|nr:hypothetical protein [Bacteriovoracaceae bacterium]
MNKISICLIFQLILATTSNAIVLPKYDVKQKQFTSCENRTEKITEIINSVEKNQNIKCNLMVNQGEPTLGFFYECGEMELKAFRNETHCESWISAMNNKSKLDYQDFVPKSVTNKAGYDVGFNSCVKSMSKKNYSVESTFEYCECYSLQTAQFSEVELQLMMKKNELSKLISKHTASCYHIISPNEGKTPGLEKKLEEKAVDKIKTSDKKNLYLIDGTSDFQLECQRKFGLNGSPKEIKSKCIELEKVKK